MKKEKEFYTSPEVDVLELRVEGVVCQSMDGGIDNGTVDDWGTLSAPIFQDFGLL